VSVYTSRLYFAFFRESLTSKNPSAVDAIYACALIICTSKKWRAPSAAKQHPPNKEGHCSTTDGEEILLV